MSDCAASPPFSASRADRVSTPARRLLVLLGALVRRELKGRYRRSLLGPAWAVVLPLGYLLVFLVLRGILDIRAPAGVSYALFSYAALVLWTFFSGAIGLCAPSVFSNASLLKKMPAVREVFPLAGVAVALADFAISFLLLLAVLLLFRRENLGWGILWLPLPVGLTALLALGLGFGLAAIGAYVRDVLFALPFVMQAWLLATPILYPLENVPERWQTLYRLNPMVGPVEAFRSILLYNRAPDFALLGTSAAVTLLLLAVTWPLFRRLSQYFADVL
jgi:lipopolysaccharide transport system permease protein